MKNNLGEEYMEKDITFYRKLAKNSEIDKDTKLTKSLNNP